jgi:hypothetical protein
METSTRLGLCQTPRPHSQNSIVSRATVIRDGKKAEALAVTRQVQKLHLPIRDASPAPAWSHLCRGSL